MTNHYELLEELATQFKHDTGLLAPFKDEPAAVGNDPRYDQSYRQQEYDKWLQSMKTIGSTAIGLTKLIAKWIGANSEHESIFLTTNPAWECNSHALLDYISEVTGISEEQIDEWCDESTKEGA